jgi:SAM-dependent methyltransferase
MNVLIKVYREMRRSYRGFQQERSGSKGLAEAKAKLLSDAGYSEEEKRWLRGTSTRIHRNDLMFNGGPEHYLSSGISAMRCIRAAMDVVGVDWEGLSRILDLPCGYGRVLRLLRQACPQAEVTACEIDVEAVRFCEREFGALPAASEIPISRVVLNGKFDLIWCGSLLTHVDEPAALEFLRFFRDRLRNGGLCLFTAHGRIPTDWMRSGKVTYGLSDEARANILSEYDAGNYAYADYPHAKNYGISAACPERMRALSAQVSGWRECLFLDHGWDECQDVYAYQAV